MYTPIDRLRILSTSIYSCIWTCCSGRCSLSNVGGIGCCSLSHSLLVWRTTLANLVRNIVVSTKIRTFRRFAAVRSAQRSTALCCWLINTFFIVILRHILQHISRLNLVFTLTLNWNQLMGSSQVLRHHSHGFASRVCYHSCLVHMLSLIGVCLTHTSDCTGATRWFSVVCCCGVVLTFVGKRIIVKHVGFGRVSRTAAWVLRTVSIAVHAYIG